MIRWIAVHTTTVAAQLTAAMILLRMGDDALTLGGAGAAVGTAVTPGVGTAVGGVVGCIIGGYGGYDAGATLAGGVYDWGENARFAPLPSMEGP